MKINTDGVLLGAVADVPHGSVKRILDIGTGTGVIALMLAQRFDHALVDAIDVDEGSFECSRVNFQTSPFFERMRSCLAGIADYETTATYDLIVSNPPFFLDSLKNIDDRKTLSRHGTLSFYNTLFEKCSKLVTAKGAFVIVWPIDIRKRIINSGYTSAMNNYQEIFIQSFPASEPFRVISFFSTDKSLLYAKRNFYIYEERGKYSSGYGELLTDFFLNF